MHILPALGQLPLSRLETAVIRQWHGSLSEAATPGPATVAKAYRLLHAILNTAVVEQKIPRNPCMVPGASAESSSERPIATVDQVYELAEAVGDRWRSLVLLATFCGLRFGELAGLTREDIDLGRAIVVVRKDLDELDGGHLQPGDVKSVASRRIVPIPEALLDEIRHHLDTFAADGPKGAVFVGRAGGRLRRTTSASTLGSQRLGPSAWKVCGSTTCATRATPSLRRPERARGSSWRGWVTRVPGPH